MPDKLYSHVKWDFGLNMSAYTVLTLCPVAPQPSTKCAVCEVTADTKKLLVCSKCRDVAYCGKEHQLRHWREGHRDECAKLCEKALVRGPRNPTMVKRLYDLIGEDLLYNAGYNGQSLAQ